MIYNLCFKYNWPTNRETQDEYTDNIASNVQDVKGIRGFGTTVITLDLKQEGESEEIAKATARGLIEQSMPEAIFRSGEVLGISKYDNPAEINEHY